MCSITHIEPRKLQQGSIEAIRGILRVYESESQLFHRRRAFFRDLSLAIHIEPMFCTPSYEGGVVDERDVVKVERLLRLQKVFHHPGCLRDVGHCGVPGEVEAKVQNICRWQNIFACAARSGACSWRSGAWISLFWCRCNPDVAPGPETTGIDYGLLLFSRERLVLHQLLHKSRHGKARAIGQVLQRPDHSCGKGLLSRGAGRLIGLASRNIVERTTWSSTCRAAEQTSVAAVEYNDDIRFGLCQGWFNLSPGNTPVTRGVIVRVATAERYAPDAGAIGSAMSCVVDNEESPRFDVVVLVQEVDDVLRRLQLWVPSHVHALVLDGEAVGIFQHFLQRVELSSISLGLIIILRGGSHPPRTHHTSSAVSVSSTFSSQPRIRTAVLSYLTGDG